MDESKIGLVGSHVEESEQEKYDRVKKLVIDFLKIRSEINGGEPGNRYEAAWKDLEIDLVDKATNILDEVTGDKIKQSQDPHERMPEDTDRDIEIAGEEALMYADWMMILHDYKK